MTGTLSVTLTSAPLATSICKHSMLFLAAAQCNGVSSSCGNRCNHTVMCHLHYHKQQDKTQHIAIFTARAYARAVLGVVILSVRLSHAWILTKLNDALQIFLYHMKGQSLCYSDTKSGWSATPPSLWNLRSKWPTPLRKTPTSTDFRS